MHPSVEPGQAVRSDGEAAHARLRRAGLRLFAQQGFVKTSTRELAEAAGVNVASISYYFGDKAGLYRAVFMGPLGDVQGDLMRLADPALDLDAALHVYYSSFLEPLRQGDEARLCMRLHFRELLEPTGLWEQGVAEGIRPQHDALVAVLCRHLGLARPDDDLQRLAVCLAGLGVHMHVGRDIIDALAPRLNRAPAAIERWVARLAEFGRAMVDAERLRRAAAPAPQRRGASKR